ncbi:phosphoglycerate mutase-like protein [Lactarius akahatsu]|uniref:Phosphoglycerate mutase-like protein n=1 Tax=Lactarius akahatsu TaxID=416441 RepID=A0AAD4LPP6_9AGAM|nr:phosphoglycerate mutase-like protein [Lactarius akahatsu]
MPAFPVILTSFLLGVQLSLASPTFLRHRDFSSYCNAPHVNVSHYEPPEKGVELLHLSVMMRHHKRSPVALVPKEREINIGVPWDCSGIKRFTYDGSGSRLSNSVTIPPGHPFREQIWAGSCEEGQLTAGGFHDSKVHGKDLWDVYHAQLGFLQAVQPSEISVRTTYVDRTKHVASGVLAGMDPSSAKRRWPAHAQPQRENSLGPSYKCPRADSLVSAAQAAPFWQDVLKKTSALKERLDAVLGTETSTAAWPSSFLFYQDILTARVCNDHPLPCNAAGGCVSEEDAAEIFELGNLEGDYLWHRAETATEYNQLTFGVLFSELADALEAPEHKLALYVAHDTSIVRLAAGLEIFPLRWPRLGSEIVIEIWRDRKNGRFVRVLYDGETVESLKWTPLYDFLGVLRNQVPDHIFERCASGSGKVEGAEGPQELFTLQ